MAATPDESEASTLSDLAARPPLTSHQSNSLPSTPRQLARDGPFDARTPSRQVQSKTHSPRSASGDSSRRIHASNPAAQPCRFMFSQVSRRRMPYSDEAGGATLLSKPSKEPKQALDPEENLRLTKEVSDLYQQLLPTQDNQSRRELLSTKLREIIAQAWPQTQFKVHVFGSSGNLLFNDRSDVDICITMNGLTTCSLAELLNRRGMKDVKCVHAKIRIVKIWDPELQLNCDLNVNNELALTNTEMVKTYIRLDPRVRPLAMTVKYWTRKRIINEASGGTLSSYTWTLLLINFLQTRSPPILPCLSLTDSDGARRSDFSNDLDRYEGFGASNQESLGELIFHFFRRYAYEIDFETVVVSVREARLLSKRDKGWHLATNNRLCVEEPFSVDRNLANTADDSAWRGLHLELRRGFDLLSQAKSLIEHVCQQYDFLESPKPSVDRSQPISRPIVLTRSLSQSGRSGRGGSVRGNRQYQGRDSTRDPGVAYRRASSAAAFGHTTIPAYPAPQLGIPLDLLRAQQRAQQQQAQQATGIHNHLAQVHSSLRAREQELRQQAANLAQASAESERSVNGASFNTQPRVSSRASTNQPAAMVALQPTMAYPYMRYDGSQWILQYPTGQTLANPALGTSSSSPLVTPAPSRRELHREQYSPTTGAAIRSQSQPARSAAPQQPLPSNPHPRHSMLTIPPSGSQENRPPYPLVQAVPSQGWVGPFLTANGWALAPASTLQSGPREYLGYGIASPPMQPQYPDGSLARTAIYDDGSYQIHQTPSLDHYNRSATSVPEVSRSPSPMPDMNGDLPPFTTDPLPTDSEASDTDVRGNTQANGKIAPLIVNGSHIPSSQSFANSEPTSSRFRRLSESDQYSKPAFAEWSASDEAVEAGSTFEQITPTYIPNDLHASSPSWHPNGHLNPLPNANETETVQNHSALVQSGNESVMSPSSTDMLKDLEVNRVISNTSGSTWPAIQNVTTSSHASSLEQGSNATLNQSRNIVGSRDNVSTLDLRVANYDQNIEKFEDSNKILSPVQETTTPSPTNSRKRNSKYDVDVEVHVNGTSTTTNVSNGDAPSTIPDRPQPSLKQPSIPPENTSNINSEHALQNSANNNLRHVSTPVAINDSKKLSTGALNTTSQTHVSTPSLSSTNTNPWQQAGSKKATKRAKQNITSPTTAQPDSSGGGGQPVPANVSERKGG